MKKVLVVATSHKTRGGITSVVNAHKQGEQWSEYQCKWIETHIDQGVFQKLLYLLRSWVTFIVLVPRYDLVHIHLSEPASAMRKLLFMPIAKLFGKRVITHFHAFSPETTINGSKQWVYRYLFTQSDKVVVLSEFWKQAVDKAFHIGDKLVVIYNPSTATPSDVSVEKRKQILYAGTVNQRKGYADLIQAFAKVAHRYPDWQVAFAGNGEIEQGLQLAKELHIEKQIKFLGWVSGEQKDIAFKESTIFCLPSYAEGFPMSVLDAWAYGLPVVTTPVGGIPDVAIDGKNMLLFTPGDIDKLSEQIDLIIKDHEVRNNIAKESTLFANNEFNLQTINKQMAELYKKTLTK